jgi:hypothetical protein
MTRGTLDLRAMRARPWDSRARGVDRDFCRLHTGRTGEAVQSARVIHDERRLPLGSGYTIVGDTAIICHAIVFVVYDKSESPRSVERLTNPVRDEQLLDRVKHAIGRDRMVRQQRAERTEPRRCYESLTHREREVTLVVMACSADRSLAQPRTPGTAHA